jgi:hypothetical protein
MNTAAGLFSPRPGIVAALLVVLAGSAHAFTIRGSLENGTTGDTNVSATVTLVNPSAGMEDVSAIKAQNGRFEIDDVDGSAPMYLLRVDYQGVEYNTPLPVTGQDQDVTVKVYESTTSWDGITVTVPHLAAVRDGDHLTIEELFQIDNQSSPPRAVSGKEGYFRIFLPAEMDSLTGCFVSATSVPVDRTPIVTSTPNLYYIDYPIRPGEMRIGVSYTVPYTSGSFSMKQVIPHDIGHLSVYTVDPTMTFMSSSHEFTAQEAVHGMAAYTIHGLKKGEVLALSFSGGDAHPAGIDAGGNNNVQVVKSEGDQLALVLLVAVMFVLMGLVFISMRDQNDPLSDAKVLRTHYDVLVARLARLDDLRAADAISDDAHRAAREDLVARLSALATRLRSHGGIHAGRDAARADTPAGTPTPQAAKRTQNS